MMKDGRRLWVFDLSREREYAKLGIPSLAERANLLADHVNSVLNVTPAPTPRL